MGTSKKYLEFTPDLHTNVPEMDDEHEHLVIQINRMQDIIANNKGDSAILEVLDDLLRFGAVHFANEEAYMQTVGTPNFEEHKKHHEHFTEKALEIRKRLISGKMGVETEVLKFLQNWLMGHIAGVDKRDYAIDVDRD